MTSGGSGPLGRFAAPAAAAACLFVIAAAVLARFLRPGVPADPFLDALAFAAFGVLIGTPLGAAAGRAEGRVEGETEAVRRINGALAQGAAANARLDALGAPAAAAVPADPPLVGAVVVPAPAAVVVPVSADPGAAVAVGVAAAQNAQRG